MKLLSKMYQLRQKCAVSACIKFRFLFSASSSKFHYWIKINLFFLTFLMPAEQLLNAKPLILNEVMNGIDLSDEAIAWIDAPSLNLNDPCKNDRDCSSLETKQVKLSHGYAGIVDGNESLYLRREIVNPFDHSIDLIATLSWTSVDNFYLALHTNGQQLIKHSSLLTPIADQDFQARFLNVKLTIPPGKSTLIARIDAINFHKGVLKLWTERQLTEYLVGERALIWMLYGIIMALALIYFFLFLTSKDEIYFWLPLSLIVFLCFDLHHRSYHHELFFMLDIDFTYNPIKMIFFTGTLACALFCKVLQEVEDVKENHPRYYKVLNVLIFGIIFAAPLSLFTSMTVGTIILLTSSALNIPSLYYQFTRDSFRNIVPVKLGILTWLPFFAGYTTFHAQIFGLMPPILIFDAGLLWGFAILSLSLGLGLGYKTWKLNEEREKAIIEQESLQSSLEVARVLQMNLLPTRAIPGYSIYHYYQPAESVGGDCFFYDDWKQFLFFAIFDVTGHDLSSAIMTGTIAGSVKKIFQYEAEMESDPKKLLKNIAISLNGSIIDFNRDRSDHLITMACAIIDSRDNQLYFLNAGHVGTYLLRPAKVQTLISRGTPLGLRVDPIFQVKSYFFGEHDKLLLMTDGINENPTDRHELLKDKVVWQKLNELKNNDINFAGLAFNGFLSSHFKEIKLRDDITFLMIGKIVEETQIKSANFEAYP